MQHRLTVLEKAELPTRYLAGESCVSIAKSHGVTPPAISGLLRRMGIPMRDASASRRKCTLNEAAFDALTPESLYWIGFIFADGCVFRKTATCACLTVRLSETDIGHIEKLARFLGSSHKIGVYRRKETRAEYAGSRRTCGISVQSVRIADRLYGVGWLPNLGSTPAPYLCSSADFWRGVIDGDGSIVANHGNTPSISLVGSYIVCEAFAAFVKNSTGYSANTLPHKSIFGVRVANGPVAVKLLKLLYGSGGCSLNRKQTKAESWFGWTRCTREQQGLNSRKFTPAIERKIATSVLSNRETALKYGLSQGGVGVIRRRYRVGSRNIRLRSVLASQCVASTESLQASKSSELPISALECSVTRHFGFGVGSGSIPVPLGRGT